MDVSKYHTRYPPREHEEAVRMLLEGLEESEPRRRDLDEKGSRRRAREAREQSGDTFQMDRSRQSKRTTAAKPQASPSRKQQSSQPKMASNKVKSDVGLSSSSVDSGSLARCSADQDDDNDDAFDFDERAQSQRVPQNEDLEFNSEESGSQDFIQVSPQIKPKRPNSATERDAHEESHVRYPLPKMQSKATSTASDSVSTSGASTDRTEHKSSHDDDLNGNYEAIPNRTIAIQCDLKLSSVKRDGYLDSASSDLASMQASSISSTRYGFYRLSPDVLEQRRQLVRSASSRNMAEQNAAPLQRNTVEAPTSISELSSNADVGEFEPEIARLRRRSLSRDQTAGDGHGDLRSVASSDKDSVAARSKHDQRFFNQRQRQQQLSSRARRDSLPRRPKTALSYVSTSRLRGQQDDEETALSRHHSGEESELSQARSNAGYNQRMSSRAMSQQVLSSAAKRNQSVRDDEAVDLGNSNSDSELGAEKYRLAQQEELVVTRRGRTMGSSPQVSRSNAIRNGPLFRHATTLAGRGQKAATSRGDTGPHVGNGGGDYVCKQGEDVMRDDDPLDLRMAQRAKPSAGRSYSTDEENQLATKTERRARISSQSGHGLMQGQRYGSMSLSRRPHHQQPLMGQRSCNLAHGDNQCESVNSTSLAADAVARHPPLTAYYQHRHGTRPALLRRDRAGSHQALPVAATLSGPAQRMSAARANDLAHVGRSSSMRQGRPCLVATNNGGSVSNRHDLEGQRATLASHRATATSDLRQDCGQLYDGSDDNCCKCADCCSGLESLNSQMNCNHTRPLDGRRFDHSQQTRPTEISSKSINRPAETVPTKRSESEDSESPLTRTWANPAQLAREHESKPSGHQGANHGDLEELTNEIDYAPRYRSSGKQQVVSAKSLDRASSRSHSMRDVSHTDASHNNSMLRTGARSRRFESIYRAGQRDDAPDEFVEGADFEGSRRLPEEVPSEEYSVCSSSVEEGGRPETLARAQASHQPLDYDSQQRLNEIGLPEPAHAVSSTRRRQTMTGSASHLGLSSVPSGLVNRYATTDRTGTAALASRPHQYQQYSRQPNAITGRAMSQQSLTRPTMPLSRRLRRSGGVIGGSDSDVGGSSISLVSRLRDGSRFENAHTRNPVVMLIPQATSRQNDSLRASSRRASSRLGRTLTRTSGSRVSSQDRKGRSTSRNGSDSESSSSMLRTLIKPRSTGVARAAPSASRGSRRRGTAGNNLDSDEENLDEIGRLASEIDSYKFRRRYSVPKDAKINWFSKLKQRVIASKS